MREISLTRGYSALVDDADHDWLLSLGKWQASLTRGGAAYAIHSMKRGRYYLHRLLVPGAVMVDHINGDTLDNRRVNLRAATAAQNARNSRAQIRSATQFKGVYRHRSTVNPWRAALSINQRQLSLGAYATPEDAARAYDAAAAEHFGEFARLNFPPEVQA